MAIKALNDIEIFLCDIDAGSKMQRQARTSAGLNKSIQMVNRQEMALA